jgi:hypothetical protein
VKTFKEYRQAKQNVVNFSMGSHSEYKQPYPVVHMSIGSHSVKSDVPIMEAAEVREFDPTAYKPFGRKKSEHNHIHENVAPMDTDRLDGRNLAAIFDYTEDSYALNSGLHNHVKSGSPLDPHVKDTAVALTEAIDQHRTTEPTHVFTGIKFPITGEFSAHDKPQILHCAGFTSTSSSIVTARGFTKPISHANDAKFGIVGKARHIMKIDMPTGTSAMSVREHSSIPSENEILVNRGTNVEVQPTPTHMGDNVYLWHGKIVSHNPSEL